MGLTKQYLRYNPAGSLNIIASQNCNVVFVTLEGQEGRFVAAGASEHVFIWDLRLGEKAQVLPGENSTVTQLAASPNKRHIAVGYSDGSIKTFDLRSGENISILVGHRSEITALAYDSEGHRLASGSKDTDIILWDIVAETGICRLVGHKGIITALSFMPNHNILISSSKDTFVKFWDLDTEHNFRTLVGHGSEVWSLVLVKEGKYLVTGCNDNELRVWKIFFVDNSKLGVSETLQKLTLDDTEISDTNYPLRCEKVGSITRAGRGRLVSLCTDFTSRVITCHGTDNTVELFYILSEEESNAKLGKRIIKARKKAATEGISEEISTDISIKDEIKRLPAIEIKVANNLKQANKVKAVDLVMGRGNELRVCIAGNFNSIELYSTIVTEKKPEINFLRSLTNHGHRTDVRAVCFSSDNLALATASGDSIKLWNRPTLACLRTVTCGYALSITFVPGDRHLMVGMKDGKMLIVDIASGDILEEIPAHSKELWSITLFPDMKGVASGGGDQTVKFWQFELVNNPESDSKAKVLSVVHLRTLKLEESVLCVRISPDSKFLAVALLDSTVKIFFLDTFKFFIQLYGHKLPVLCMDISSDSTLIATGSADRNIKIWGMDHGDCHKSIFAHDDSVTGLAFVPRTHYFFTCGKDGKLKEWDADIFQKILTFQGHSGEAWNCAVSPNGAFVASCGSDKVVRLFERSAETLVLEDEAEDERERQENELAIEETTVVPGQKAQILPSRKTVSSQRGAELILECIDLAKVYEEELQAVTPPNPAPPLPLQMQMYKCETVEDYLLEVVKRIRGSDLEEALQVLPFSVACDILKMIPKLLKTKLHTELKLKLALTIVKMHHNPIKASADLLPTIEAIQEIGMPQLRSLMDMVGVNMYGMCYKRRLLEEKEGIQLFKEATERRKSKKNELKNKEKAKKRALVTL